MRYVPERSTAGSCSTAGDGHSVCCLAQCVLFALGQSRHAWLQAADNDGFFVVDCPCTVMGAVEQFVGRCHRVASEMELVSPSDIDSPLLHVLHL